MVYVSSKLFLEKREKLRKTNKNLKPWMCSQLLADSGDKTSSSCRFLRPHFQTVCSKQLFLFSILHSKMSINMCKMCHKVPNGKNLPSESPNFRNFIFVSNFTDILFLLSTSLRPHYQNSFFSKYIFFFF